MQNQLLYPVLEGINTIDGGEKDTIERNYEHCSDGNVEASELELKKISNIVNYGEVQQ